MPSELTKALLLEEVVAPSAISDALFVSVTNSVPLVQALLDTGAISPEVLARYLNRSEAPYFHHATLDRELVERLPDGLCERLFAIPVAQDPTTGAVDALVADATDRHPADEMAFHLGVPVRLVRGPLSAIVEGLRKLRPRAAPPRHHPPQEDENLYDSRPRAPTRFSATLPPPDPVLSSSRRLHAREAVAEPVFGARRPEPALVLPLDDADLVPRSRRHGASEEPKPARQDPREPREERRQQDGRPDGPSLETRLKDLRMHDARMQSLRDTRAGIGTLDTPDRARPPEDTRARPNAKEPHDGQRRAGRGESSRGSWSPGSSFEAAFARARLTRPPSPGAAPKSSRGHDTPPWGTPVHAPDSDNPPSGFGSEIPIPLTRRAAPGERGPSSPRVSFIPGPPPFPNTGPYAAYSPQIPYADMGLIPAAVRAATSRDEVLELALTGARMVALRVALFVVKHNGYRGWACTPEFGDRDALQGILLPLDEGVFGASVREGVYLGPIKVDAIHAPLVGVMRTVSRDVAIVPVTVGSKPVVIIVADELGDTMSGTRRLEELAKAAGESLARIVRHRRDGAP